MLINFSPMELKVREIEDKDIDLIADYWLTSDPEFLISMGVDLAKLPTRLELKEMLTQQIDTPLQKKQSYALIWSIDGKPVGHCNVNQIEFGQHAFMHLHLWKEEYRKKGAGMVLLRKSVQHFFEKLHLQELYCEPYALNPAPNRILEKMDFSLEKTYQTVPGSLNFYQTVNRWRLDRKQLDELLP